MNYVMICLLLVQPIVSIFGQTTWETNTIKMDNRFNNSIEISSIVYYDNKLYLASPKCDSIYIGQINSKDELEIIQVKSLDECDYEGASYYNNNFYFSDDSKNAIFKYNSALDEKPTRYPIRLRGHEGAKDNLGFEGLAALNDSIFYILLENDAPKRPDILYKGYLRNGSIDIVEEKRLIVDNKERYCDLFYNRKMNTLFLLKTKKGGYIIDSLQLDSSYNIGDSNPSILTYKVHDMSEYINKKGKEKYGTNIEGITMADENTFYIISDNCNPNKNVKVNCDCGEVGENRKTLLVRIKRRTY